MVARPQPRYNLLMTRNAAKLFEEARQLPPGDLDWLIQSLLGITEEEAYATWKKDLDEPESGYEEWFRAGVEEALADTKPSTPHQEVVNEIRNVLRAARQGKRLKASA